MLFNRRKKAMASSGLAAQELFAEERPSYDPGYDPENKRIVTLVSNHASKKAYRTRGIEDIGASNNWKGWLYLAPVIILVAIFLIYPLINTIFIAFTGGYEYATGKFDYLTFDNFTYIFGLTTNAAGGREINFVNYAIPNTFLLVIITVPVSIFLAMTTSPSRSRSGTAPISRRYMRTGSVLRAAKSPESSAERSRGNSSAPSSVSSNTMSPFLMRDIMVSSAALGCSIISFIMK